MIKYHKFLLNEGLFGPTKGKMFFSKRFIEFLNNMVSPLSKDLLKVLDSDDEFANSYIDLCDTEADKVSFIAYNRASRLQDFDEEIDMVSPKDDSPVWGEKYRQTIRVGSFVLNLLPQYSTTKELTNFINEFVGKQESSKYTLKLVDGENIRKYYLVDNYYNPTPDIVYRDDVPEDENDPRTVLMKSCMKQPEKQIFFDIYVKNPNQCKMLVMLNRKNELVARAIVWMTVKIKINDKFEKGTLLDRIYYTNETDVEIFKDYARKNGWMYKTEQTKDCVTVFYNGKVVNINDCPIRTMLEVSGPFDKYPYMDTLCFLTPMTGRLATNRGEMPKDKETGKVIFCDRFQLRKINGGYLKLRKE